MCFSIDVSILLMDTKVINRSEGKDSFDKYGSFSYDWYCASVHISKTKTYQFYHWRFLCFSQNTSSYELQKRFDLFFLRKSWMPWA